MTSWFANLQQSAALQATLWGEHVCKKGCLHCSHSLSFFHQFELGLKLNSESLSGKYFLRIRREHFYFYPMQQLSNDL